MASAGSSCTRVRCLIARIYAASSITNRRELRRLAVKVELGTRIDDPAQLKGRFDVAILATGAVANPCPKSSPSTGVMSWFDVLANGAPAPEENNSRAVMVDDGSAFWWTYGVAEALAEAGWRVLIATPSSVIAGAIPHESVGPLLADSAARVRSTACSRRCTQ